MLVTEEHTCVKACSVQKHESSVCRTIRWGARVLVVKLYFEAVDTGTGRCERHIDGCSIRWVYGKSWRKGREARSQDERLRI